MKYNDSGEKPGFQDVISPPTSVVCVREKRLVLIFPQVYNLSSRRSVNSCENHIRESQALSLELLIMTNFPAAKTSRLARFLDLIQLADQCHGATRDHGRGGHRLVEPDRLLSQVEGAERGPEEECDDEDPHRAAFLRQSSVPSTMAAIVNRSAT